jgi:hypothetical protein
MARLSRAALATVAVLAGCSPAGDRTEAEAAAGGLCSSWSAEPAGQGASFLGREILILF